MQLELTGMEILCKNRWTSAFYHVADAKQSLLKPVAHNDYTSTGIFEHVICLFSLHTNLTEIHRDVISGI